MSIGIYDILCYCRCGRRYSYCIYMLLGGVACLLVLAVPSVKGTLIKLISLLSL